MCFGDLALQEVRQDFYYPFREGRPVMAPAPDGHSADAKDAGGRTVSPEHYFECEIVPTAKRPALEA
jgi:hypothetical protein